MKQQIEQKIVEWIGKQEKTFLDPRNATMFKTIKQDLRAKAPQLTQDIIELVVSEIEKDVADLRAEHSNTARHGDDPDSAYDRVESLLWNYKTKLKQ